MNIVNPVDIEDWGRLLCLVVVPELHFPEEDLRAALGYLPAIVAEDDVVAALRQHEELRDHLAPAVASATTPSPPGPRTLPL
uniref:Uncharacterized protein n=1 Tax=Arundo donax TaxID=35708 RepID=A0A0A9GR33_ARUDO